jgi:hypothetical protein
MSGLILCRDTNYADWLLTENQGKQNLPSTPISNSLLIDIPNIRRF